jgi:general secretion pathway protein F
MPSFQYRALNGSGKMVTGAIVAATAQEVADRIDELGLVLIEKVAVDQTTPRRSIFDGFNKPKPEDVTIFTRDLALLLRAGARINDALELLASDTDVGRLRPIVADVRSRVLSGESLADALTHYPELFPSMYVALVRVGEVSGTVEHILEVLAEERARAEAVRRKLGDAMRYPIFILGAAGAVMIFFLMFVLPQFADVLKDFGAKVDPMISVFLSASTFLRANTDAVMIGALVFLVVSWLLLRRPEVRRALFSVATRPPFVRQLLTSYQTAIFCRNLGVLLGSGVNLTTTLRILVDMMATAGATSAWKDAAERIRHGAKLSEALSDTQALPPIAARMLRLGDETGQLPLLAGRVAEFYEAKLQRSLDRAVGIAGPAAVILISIVVGGLIVSIMTALMSVSQIVG